MARQGNGRGLEGSRSRAGRALEVTALLYTAGWALHGYDHLRRGADLTPPAVFWAGWVGLAVGYVVVYMVMRGHRLGPLGAVGLGFTPAIAFTVIHLPPKWGFFSQPYRDGVDVFSWLIVAFAILSAFAFGVAGWSALRRQQAETGEPLLSRATS